MVQARGISIGELVMTMALTLTFTFALALALALVFSFPSFRATLGLDGIWFLFASSPDPELLRSPFRLWRDPKSEHTRSGTKPWILRSGTYCVEYKYICSIYTSRPPSSGTVQVARRHSRLVDPFTSTSIISIISISIHLLDVASRLTFKLDLDLRD